MEAHVRIDEGISRGAQHAHKPPTPRVEPSGKGSMTVPKELNPDAVIDLYLTEQTTSQIASSLGVTRKALTAWLRATVPDKWRQAQALRALCLKDDSQAEIAQARDALSLARARELLRSAQFDLQMLDPDFRQQAPAVNIQANGPLSVQIVSFAVADTPNPVKC